MENKENSYDVINSVNEIYLKLSNATDNPLISKLYKDIVVGRKTAKMVSHNLHSTISLLTMMLNKLQEEECNHEQLNNTCKNCITGIEKHIKSLQNFVKESSLN